MARSGVSSLKRMYKYGVMSVGNLLLLASRIQCSFSDATHPPSRAFTRQTGQAEIGNRRVPSPAVPEDRVASLTPSSSSELQLQTAENNAGASTRAPGAPTQRVAAFDDRVVIKDGIFGAVEVSEPCLLELMASEEVSRLKGVNQYGVMALMNMLPPVSRFQHSVGTMLCVRALGGSVEEQIAALLHDVSHTALSHVSDHIRLRRLPADEVPSDEEEGTRSFHEVQKLRYLKGTGIPEMLRRHGYDWVLLLSDDSRFGLLEQPAPRLCADRLDYGLRDSVAFGNLSVADASALIRQCVGVERGGQRTIACKGVRLARRFANAYINSDRDVWSLPLYRCYYEHVGRTISDAIECGVISGSQLWNTDHGFMNYLRASVKGQQDLERRVSVIDTWNESCAILVGPREEHDYALQVKARAIDPDILDEREELRRLSELDDEFRTRLDAHICSRTKTFYFKLNCYH